MRLEKWQRNVVFETIPAAGLDPNAFDLVGDDNDEPEFSLKHKWSESCFIIGGSAGNYLLRIVVGDASPVSLMGRDWAAMI